MYLDEAVRERYAGGAREREAALCCPVEYDRGLLKPLPQEILDKDYGCGDPSRHAREGDIVLDLGSGGGKICYMAAQLVGPSGRVIGVDINDEMLNLARTYQGEMAAKLGGDRVSFRKGYIQDLALDVEAMEEYLSTHPVTDVTALGAFKDWRTAQRKHRPLIADASVDLVISNCVPNLVGDAEKQYLPREIFRVLKPGGRMAISDIVSDEPVPPHLKEDGKLWSGCISGAFQELDFVQAFVDAGFHSVRIEQWSREPWQVVEGIEFRAVTLTAHKGSGKECLDRGHAVIYRGPYAEIRDEEGHVYFRGERIAVCERPFRTLTEGPYRHDFIGVEPVVLAEPRDWCASPGTRRSAAEAKGGRQIVVCGQTGCAC